MNRPIFKNILVVIATVTIAACGGGGGGGGGDYGGGGGGGGYGKNPPTIVVHGNQTERLPLAYKRYLMNRFRKRFKLQGTPVRLVFKTSDNPFKGRRNKLTPRQMRKKKRLMKFINKKK